MSKKKQRPVEMPVETDTPEQLAPAAEPKAPKAKRGAFNVIMSLIVAILGVATLFIPYGEAKVSAFDSLVMENMFDYGIYLLHVGVAFTVLFALIALISAKKSACFTRLAAFTCASGITAITVFDCLEVGSIDLILAALTVASALLFLIINKKTRKNHAFANFIHLIFSWIFIALFIVGTGDLAVEISKGANASMFLAATGFALLAVFWATVALGSQNDRVSSILRGIIELVSGILLCFAVLIPAREDASILVIVAAAVAAIHLIVTAGLAISKSKNDFEKAKEEVQNTFALEEYAEAYPYEGGPVAGVQMAEEVNPTFRPLTPHINTAGYDFYNCKSFDPFIASLDNDERNQFTEIFILKFKGTMPELPEYEVGGNNKEFFRKIFIYLGQYRDRIPSGLLSKIYQYSIKLS